MESHFKNTLATQLFKYNELNAFADSMNQHNHSTQLLSIFTEIVKAHYNPE